MSISEPERAALGERIRVRRERLFGTKRAAYQEADVNAATWDKAEAGESIRGDRLRKIVRTLWPETEGDWTAIGMVEERPVMGDGVTLHELEQRIVDLEQQLAELYGGKPPTPSDEKPESPGVSA